MKILHTADWHLGKRLEKFSRLEEQREVLEEIIGLADEHQVDVVLIAGDLFDNFNPANEAVELFYKTLKRLSNNGRRAVIAIAGNHDSPERIGAPDPLGRECGIFFSGFPHSVISPCQLDSGVCISKSEPGFIELNIPGHSFPLRIIHTPYANEYRLKSFLGVQDEEQNLRDLLQAHWRKLADQYCDDQGVNLLLSHLYLMKKGAEAPEEPDDEKPILHVGGAQAIYSENIPPQIQYVALGHLHRHQQVDNQPCPIVYSSSPLSYSFSEAGQTKYVILVNAAPGQKVSYDKLSLQSGKPLIRKKFDHIDTAVDWLSNHQDALVELTLESDDYLRAEDRKRVFQSHPGIVSIIPVVKNAHFAETEKADLDITGHIEDLFISYFKHKHGASPNENILELFKEIRAENPTE